MEEILKKIMNAKCVSMHDSNYRCYGKGCNGQCAQFQVTLIELNEETTRKVQEANEIIH
jgi:hypothetical protein